MKAYKILALLKRVEKMKAGDKRVLINGFPCKVDYRIIADDLFEDAVSAMKELIDVQEQVKNCSIPDVVEQSEQLRAFGEIIAQKMHNGERFQLRDEVDKFLSL